MSKVLGEIHNLRLLHFGFQDTNKSNSTRKIRKTTPNFKKQEKFAPDCFTTKCAKLLQNKSASQTCLQSKRRKKRIRVVFKRPSSQLKRPVIRRSTSLYELKQKLSSASSQVANKTKEKLRCITSKSLKSQSCKHHSNNKDVRILFTTETGKKYKCFRNERCNDVKKLDCIYNSKSSKLCNLKSHQQLYNCCCQIPRNDNDKCSRSPDKNQEHNKDSQTLKHSIYESGNQTYVNNYSTSCSYNQTDFTCKAPDQPYAKDARVSTNERCPQRSKCVCVTPSCLDIPRNGSGDDNNLSGHILKHYKKLPTCINKINQTHESKTCKVCPNKFQRKLPLYSRGLAHRKTYVISALKYITFVVTIILWSPCIIIVGLCWLLTYPVRPGNIFKKMNVGCSKKNRSCYDDRSDSWEPGRPFGTITQKIQYAFNTFYSLFKEKQSKKSDCFKVPVFDPSSQKNCFYNPYHNLRPDPKIKYRVYYNRHKGWVMKPQTNRKRCTYKHFKHNLPSASCYVTTSPPDIFTNKGYDYAVSQDSSSSLDIKYRKSVSFEDKIPEGGDLNDLSYKKSHFNPPIQRKIIPKKSLDHIPCDCLYNNIPIYTRRRRPRRYKKIKQRGLSPKHGRKKAVLKDSYYKNELEILQPKCKCINLRKGDVWWCKRKIINIGKFINKVDRDVWKYDLCPGTSCTTPKTISCSRVYEDCPSNDSYLLSFCKFYGTIVLFFLFIIFTCIWLPIIYFCYHCLSFILKCVRNCL